MAEPIDLEDVESEIDLSEQISSYTESELKQIENLTLEGQNHWKKILEESGKLAGLQKSVLLAKNRDSVTQLYIAIETDKVEVVDAVMALTDVDILREMFTYKINTRDTVL